MSRVFSFADLLRIDALSGFTERALLYIENDELVNHYLRKLGFNLSRPIQYLPAKHRTLDGKIVVGFRAVGDVSSNPVFLRSKLCSSAEYLVAVSKRDNALMQLMNNLSDGAGGLASIADDLPWVAADNEPDASKIALQLELMIAERDSIRGNPYREDGSLWYPGELESPAPWKYKGK